MGATVNLKLLRMGCDTMYSGKWRKKVFLFEKKLF